MSMKDYPDQTRNLNPHKEARVAMSIWGKEYSEQGGGSMDFYDRLSIDRQRLCVRVVDAIAQSETRAKPVV